MLLKLHKRSNYRLLQRHLDSGRKNPAKARFPSSSSLFCGSCDPDDWEFTPVSLFNDFDNPIQTGICGGISPYFD